MIYIFPPQDVICSDLLGVLKRALTQHVAVRVSMYQGLGNVSGINPELSLPFLDILHQHGISQKWIPLSEDKTSNLFGETRRAAVWNLDDLIVEHATEVEVTVRKYISYQNGMPHASCRRSKSYTDSYQNANINKSFRLQAKGLHQGYPKIFDRQIIFWQSGYLLYL